MTKEKIIQELTNVQDSLIAISQRKHFIDNYEDIIDSLNTLLDIKVEIENYWKYCPDGA